MRRVLDDMRFAGDALLTDIATITPLLSCLDPAKQAPGSVLRATGIGHGQSADQARPNWWADHERRAEKLNAQIAVRLHYAPCWSPPGCGYVCEAALNRQPAAGKIGHYCWVARWRITWRRGMTVMPVLCGGRADRPPRRTCACWQKPSCAAPRRPGGRAAWPERCRPRRAWTGSARPPRRST